MPACNCLPPCLPATAPLPPSLPPSLQLPLPACPRLTSASTVGLPRESNTWRALTEMMAEGALAFSCSACSRGQEESRAGRWRAKQGRAAGPGGEGGCQMSGRQAGGEGWGEAPAGIPAGSAADAGRFTTAAAGDAAAGDAAAAAADPAAMCSSVAGFWLAAQPLLPGWRHAATLRRTMKAKGSVGLALMVALMASSTTFCSWCSSMYAAAACNRQRPTRTAQVGSARVRRRARARCRRCTASLGGGAAAAGIGRPVGHGQPPDQGHKRPRLPA